MDRKIEQAKSVDLTQFIDIRVAMKNPICNALTKLLKQRKDIINMYFSAKNDETKKSLLEHFKLYNNNIKDLLGL